MYLRIGIVKSYAAHTLFQVQHIDFTVTDHRS